MITETAIRWECKPFSDLKADELYAMLRLRSEVFVVEQNCVYLDLDLKDKQAYHVAGWIKDELIGYTRLLPPGLAFKEPSIGRVVTSPSARRTGAGRKLMEYSIEKIISFYGKQPIRIGAQLYLKRFYESLGFNQSSDIYLEDDIEHIEMVFPILEN